MRGAGAKGRSESTLCHGLSELFIERMLFDDGQLVNRTPGEYKGTPALDVPGCDAMVI